ncbi:hypothetical protein D3C71_1712910 [compost metagenome]
MFRFRQYLARDSGDGIDIHAFLRRDWHHIEEVHLLAEERNVRQQLGLVGDVVDLVDRQHNRAFQAAQFVDHHFIVGGPVSTFNYEDHQLDVAD